MAIRRHFLAIVLMPAIAFCAPGVQKSDAASNLDSHMKAESLPLLEVAIGWPLAKLAAHSPDVAGLPMSATDRIGAYLNTPVRFRYMGDKIRFEIPRTHAFTVYQESGRVSSLDVELPMFVGDPKPAFSKLQELSREFDNMHLTRFYDAGRGCSTKDDIQAAAREFARIPGAHMLGITVGCWQFDNVLYMTGITRFQRHLSLSDGSEGTVAVYKVDIAVWDKDAFYGRRPASSDAAQ